MQWLDYPSTTTFLTPNSRLSAALLKKHHQWQLEQGHRTWESLIMLPFSAWLTRLWESYTVQHIASHPTLLQAEQEQLLWDDILQQSPEKTFLLQLSHTAELAKTAWKTLKEWRVDIHESFLGATEDSLIFQQWAKKFQTLCEKNFWLDSSSLADFIAEKIQAGIIKPPEYIILIGFTELSPLYQYLLDCCAAQGSNITHSLSTPSPSGGRCPTGRMGESKSIKRISLPDESTEMLVLAQWAKATHQSHPNHTIGCVIPDLQHCRERLLAIFSEVFSAENTYTLDHTALPFNISAGKKLSDYPITYAALQLLDIPDNTLSLDQLTLLLRSPFIGEAEQECMARAVFGNQLLRDNQQTIAFDDVHLKQHCPLLAKRLQDLKNLQQERNQKRLPSAWATHFMQTLTQLGWPGERSLNSHEYQLVKNAWLKLLEDYAAYDTILGEISPSQASYHVRYLADKIMFQPQSPDASIHILGTLEAADIPFDHLWVMGVDDTTWPSSPKPNPFIPLHEQKTRCMPHASAERELLYCQQLTQQFMRSANQVIFSHALHREETELRVSPIISDVPEITRDDLLLSETSFAAKTIYAAKAIEFFTDEKVRPVSPDEKIRGGTSIFKLQAACPFKAFAEIRLHAKQIDSPTLGLRAKDRGELLHKAMERIWRELRNQQTLAHYEETALSQLIQNSVQQALSRVMPPSKQSSRYAMLEAERLEKLIRKWLALEKLRHSFEVIKQEEEQKTLVGSIPVTFRIDRVDRLENGKQVIIDYKTGKQVSLDSWFGERPEEPQLPLYCIAAPDETIGILFAQINSEKLRFEGICELSLGIDSVKPLEKIKQSEASDWSAQIEQWRSVLEKLGQQFMQGNATVDPKHPVETCEHCHLQTFCRVGKIDA